MSMSDLDFFSILMISSIFITNLKKGDDTILPLFLCQPNWHKNKCDFQQGIFGRIWRRDLSKRNYSPRR